MGKALGSISAAELRVGVGFSILPKYDTWDQQAGQWTRSFVSCQAPLHGLGSHILPSALGGAGPWPLSCGQWAWCPGHTEPSMGMHHGCWLFLYRQLGVRVLKGGLPCPLPAVCGQSTPPGCSHCPSTLGHPALCPLLISLIYIEAVLGNSR